MKSPLREANENVVLDASAKAELSPSLSTPVRRTKRVASPGSALGKRAPVSAVSVCYITPALLRRIIGGRAFKEVTSLALDVGKEHGRIRVIEQLDEFTSLRELDVSCHEVSLRENNSSATTWRGPPIMWQVTRCDKLAALPQLEKLTLSHNRLVRQSAASTPSLRIAAGGTAWKRAGPALLRSEGSDEHNQFGTALCPSGTEWGAPHVTGWVPPRYWCYASQVERHRTAAQARRAARGA